VRKRKLDAETATPAGQLAQHIGTEGRQEQPADDFDIDGVDFEHDDETLATALLYKKLMVSKLLNISTF
jgi:hypothetical protein